MNNKGFSKTRILLVIPIFLILLLLILDTFISSLETNRLRNTTMNIVKDAMDSDISYDEYYDFIKRQYELKKYDTDMLLVEANNYTVYVENEYRYFGLFSSLKTYNYITEEVNVLGFKINVIKSLKKVEQKYGEISILGVKFKVKRGSKAIVKLRAKRNYDDEIEFEFEK